MRASGCGWMKTKVDTISGNQSLSILPLGYVFKCLLSLTAFFSHLSHRRPFKSVPMCLSVGIMKRKKTQLTTPSSSKAVTTERAFLTHLLRTLSQSLLRLTSPSMGSRILQVEPLALFPHSLSPQEGGHNRFPKSIDSRSPTLRVGEGASGNLQEPWKILDTCTCSKQPTSDLMSCFSNTWESQFQVSSLSC